MIGTYGDLRDLLELQGFSEDRHREFKKGLPWDELKFKITKASLSMANLQDGGSVIIGIEEDQHGRFELSGMEKETSETFKIDDIQSFVNEYADPPIEIRLDEIKNNDKYFIILSILEFEQQPVICKKDYQGNGKKCLERGRIYYRPKNKIESTDSFSHHDMRELMMFATEKFHSIQVKACKKLKESEQNEEDKKIKTKEFFDGELKNF